MFDADPNDPTVTHRPLTPQPRQGADARRSAWRALLSVLLAAVVIAGSAAVGVLFVDLASQRSIEPGSQSPTPIAILPVADVDGNDVSNLARFPGAIRTAYLRERQGSTIVTVIEYVTSADLDDVRAFYRRIFRENDWELIELDFSGGDWIFLVERGARAAFIEIEQRDSHVSIDIELERRVAAATATPNPTPTPAPRPQPPPPPPGDDDDDDDD